MLCEIIVNVVGVYVGVVNWDIRFNVSVLREIPVNVFSVIVGVVNWTVWCNISVFC